MFSFFIVSTFLLLLVSSRTTASPAFERGYSRLASDIPSCIYPTSDGGFILAGTTIDSTYMSRAYFVIRVDSTGEVLWTRVIGDAFDRYSSAITEVPGKGFGLVGSHESVFYDLVAEVLMLDDTGSVYLANSFPPTDGWGTYGVGILPNQDSTVTITAYTDGFLFNNFYSLWRLDSLLSARWISFLSLDGSEMNMNSVVVDDSSYVSLSYYSDYFYSIPDIINASEVRKISSAGLSVRDSVYALSFRSTCIAVDHTGHSVIAGASDSSGIRELRIAKIDHQGSLDWSRRFPAPWSDQPVSIQALSDGGYVVLSTRQSPVFPDLHDVSLTKLNAMGDSIWTRVYGGAGEDRAVQVCLTEDKGFGILLFSKSFEHGELYVIRTDSNGIVNTRFRINGPGAYQCSGDTATLSIDPLPAGFSVLWSNGDTSTSIRVTSSGNYYAIVTDTAGASFKTNIHTLYFASVPVVQFNVADSVSLCPGSRIELNAFTDASFTYAWYLDGVGLFDGGTSSYQPQTAGLYSLVVSNYCGLDSGAVFIDSIYPVPIIPAVTVTGTVPVCPGDSVLLTVPGGMQSQQWLFIPDFQVIPISGAVDTFIYVDEPGSYAVREIDNNGCAVLTSPVPVLFDSDPVFVNANGPLSFCLGGQVELTAPAGTNYLWTTGDSTQVISVNSSGSFAFSCRTLSGCFKRSDTLAVSVLQLPHVTLGPDTTICTSDSLVIFAGSGFNSYHWHDGSDLDSYTVLPFQSTADSMFVSVYVTDTNSCSNADTMLVRFDVCTGVDESFQSRTVSVFPNPVYSSTGKFNVRFPYASIWTIRFVAADGCVKRTIRMTGVEAVVPLEGISAGYYRIDVVSDKQERFGSSMILLHD